MTLNPSTEICIEHWNSKHRRNHPPENVFFAGLMAYGCNLGLTRMAQTSRHLSENTLENTVNWYFSLENLRKANDTLVALMGRLKIGELFRKAPKVVHSSSDGQKFYIQVDSIHANYSYTLARRKGSYSTASLTRCTGCFSPPLSVLLNGKPAMSLTG